MSPTIGIVLVHYGHAPTTAKCLSSLLKHTTAILYVVDNASPDDSLAQLQQQFLNPRLQWLALPNNRGYGAGANAGFALAWQQGMNSVLLLNNDTWIQDDVAAILDTYSQHYQHQALLTGTIYQPDGQIWYSGGWIDLPAVRAYHRHHAASLGKVHFISGCMLWVTRPVFERLGGFDESFFMYWEDGDLSFRATALGIPMIYVPEAHIWHQVSASTPQAMAQYYQNRNRWAMIRQYGTAWQQTQFAIRSGLGVGWRCLRIPARYWRSHWQAWIDGWRGEGGPKQGES